MRGVPATARPGRDAPQAESRGGRLAEPEALHSSSPLPVMGGVEMT
jgi:hypothetical protein